MSDRMSQDDRIKMAQRRQPPPEQRQPFPSTTSRPPGHAGSKPPMTSFPPKMRIAMDAAMRKPIIAPKHTNGPHSNGPQSKPNGPTMGPSPRVPPLSLRHRAPPDGRYMQQPMQPPIQHPVQPPMRDPMQPPYKAVTVPRVDPQMAPPSAPLHSTTIPHSPHHAQSSHQRSPGPAGRPAHAPSQHGQSKRPTMGTPEWNPLLHSTMNPNSNPFEPSSPPRMKRDDQSRAQRLETNPRSRPHGNHASLSPSRDRRRYVNDGDESTHRSREHLNPESRPFMPQAQRDKIDRYRQASPTRQGEYPRLVTKPVRVPSARMPERQAIQPPLHSSRNTHQTAYPQHTG